MKGFIKMFLLFSMILFGYYCFAPSIPESWVYNATKYQERMDETPDVTAASIKRPYWSDPDTPTIQENVHKHFPGLQAKIHHTLHNIRIATQHAVAAFQHSLSTESDTNR